MTDQQEMDDYLNGVSTTKPTIMAKDKKNWTDAEKLAEIERIVNKGKSTPKTVGVEELKKWGVIVKFNKSGGIKDVTVKQTRKAD